MIRVTHKSIAGLALLALSAFLSTARADSLAIEGLEYKNVRLLGLDGQTLKVQISGRTQSVDLARLSKLEVDELPQLAKARQALDNNQPERAATLFDEALRVLPARKQFLKPYLQVQRVRALDATGKFDQAVRGFLTLALSHPQPYFLEAMPKNVSGSEAQRKQVLQRIDFVLKSTRNKRTQRVLKDLAESIRKGETKPASKNGNGNVTNRTTASTGTTRTGPASAQVRARPSRYHRVIQGIQATINDGNYDKAQELIDKMYQQAEAPVPALTFLTAQALAGKGRHMDAAIAFLRVVILWPDSPNATGALIGAGRSFQALGDNRTALTLWTEAKDKAQDPQTRNRIDALLKSISAE